MNTNTEVLKTDLPGKPLIPCTSCEAVTPHKVIASHETEVFVADDNLQTAMQIVRCEVCKMVSFRELYATRGFHEKNSAGVWVDPVSEFRYIRSSNSPNRRFNADESTGIFD